ncbi:MAG TPA: ATP-binding protein, partial [Stellaceae bacterium]|nr:ATP-binding protein [Stellaceae bacterium]
GDGLLPALPLIAVAIVLLIAQIIALRPVLLGLDRIRRNVARMIEDEPPAVEIRTTSPRVNGLWRAIVRLDRGHRAQRSRLDLELALARAVLAALPDPLLVIDSHRRITRANGAAAELFGDRLVSHDLATAIRNPAVLAAADAVLRGGGERLVEFELSVPITRDFRARIERVQGNEAAALVALTDLTTLKRAEQLRADFVANASHELRTPLSAVIGFIETLEGPAAEDAEARARFLPIMRQQANRMGRLVNDLLSLSRIELNEHLPPRDTVDLGAVLRGVAETLALKAEARNMRIVLEPPVSAAFVIGDDEELSQLFQNLVDNAIKYGDDGTAVTIGAGPSTRLKNGVAIAVRDRGEGIDRQHIPRLTERFYRVDSARSRAMGGTGLGLAIVKHIVSRHRGLLEIDSVPGEGSCFSVHLPVAGAEVLTAPAA